MSERLARLFHEAYERLAPEYGYETREETRDFDPESPNGRLMIAVCGEVEAALEADHNRLRGVERAARAYRDVLTSRWFSSAPTQAEQDAAWKLWEALEALDSLNRRKLSEQSEGG